MCSRSAPDIQVDKPALSIPAVFPPLEAQILQLSLGQNLTLKQISGLLNISVERCKQLKLKAIRRYKALKPK
jgi:DNA-directed RNA polymerase specialized sigma subunit